MVRQQSMTSELNKIETLALMGKKLTSLISGCGLLRRMPNIKELNLSNNKIAGFGQLNELKSLHSLVLNGNRIKEINNLNLPVLTNLSLDRNFISKLTGLRGLKKLEDLSLEGNLITVASMQDMGYNLVSLRELSLASNKITAV